jgi:rubrerythrin
MQAMGLDEARHWEGLNRIFVELGEEPKPITDFKAALGINYVIMRCGDFDQWLWCIQICDIIAGVLYNNIKTSCDNKLLQSLFEGFLRDEARHHRFCNLFFEREAGKFNKDQQKRYRRQGEKLVKKFENLMKIHLVDYMSMMGCDAKVSFEKVAKAVEGQAKKYGFVD